MSVAIRYYSKSGNTKKLADAIAKVVDAEPLTVLTALKEPVDVLFLGSSVYAAGIDEEVKRFLRENKSKIGCIVNFSTAALLPSTYNQVSKLANELGIKVSKDEFHCRGSFGIMHRNRPNDDDLKAVMEFAKNIIK